MKSEVFFIDTNIVMYAAGKEHPYKDACARVISQLADGSFHRDIGTPITDTEVFQEILYRYALVKRWESATQICRSFLKLGLEIFSVDATDVETMIALAEAYKEKEIPPRDLVHVAVMINHSVRKMISVDSHFDLIKEVTRIDPMNLW
jgi:uncharacterized protein